MQVYTETGLIAVECWQARWVLSAAPPPLSWACWYMIQSLCGGKGPSETSHPPMSARMSRHSQAPQARSLKRVSSDPGSHQRVWDSEMFTSTSGPGLSAGRSQVALQISPLRAVSGRPVCFTSQTQLFMAAFPSDVLSDVLSPSHQRGPPGPCDHSTAQYVTDGPHVTFNRRSSL